MRGAHARAAARSSAGVLAACALAGGGVLLAGCGGTRQDAGEPNASFRVELVRAIFPLRQVIARPTIFLLAVRNAGLRTVPNVAVTVDSFTYVSKYPQLSASKRPVWVIEQGPGAKASPPVESQEVTQPGSAQTAYVNTWALGPLVHGQTQTFRWLVVPVKPGIHVVHFAVAAGLSGKAKATLAGGESPQGAFVVAIAGRPPQTYVDPRTGKVRVGTGPKIP
ncbi:MAG TPA: hypothetical protein VN772_02250 [Solirubrobacteraceae bacterium]|nr:hypothetical protein [Solirubrobacteraceae bacterium]